MEEDLWPMSFLNLIVFPAVCQDGEGWGVGREEEGEKKKRHQNTAHSFRCGL